MKYFTIQEMISTDTGIYNVPGVNEMANMVTLINEVLDPARVLVGLPITINSGYRSKEVNKAVGGKPNSQHLKGEAADITCEDNEKLFQIIRDNLEFDQLINEKNFSWIHVSYSSNNNRKEVLQIS